MSRRSQRRLRCSESVVVALCLLYSLLNLGGCRSSEPAITQVYSIARDSVSSATNDSIDVTFRFHLIRDYDDNGTLRKEEMNGVGTAHLRVATLTTRTETIRADSISQTPSDTFDLPPEKALARRFSHSERMLSLYIVGFAIFATVMHYIVKRIRGK